MEIKKKDVIQAINECRPLKEVQEENSKEEWNMTPLEERNLVWELLELLIIKNDLKIESEFLDPTSEAHDIVFGNFVKGHPMCFEENICGLMADLTRKLPSDYIIARDYMLGTGEAVIGLSKI